MFKNWIKQNIKNRMKCCHTLPEKSLKKIFSVGFNAWKTDSLFIINLLMVSFPVWWKNECNAHAKSWEPIKPLFYVFHYFIKKSPAWTRVAECVGENILSRVIQSKRYLFRLVSFATIQEYNNNFLQSLLYLHPQPP